ncbi:MAG: hypothetical protein ACRBM6_23775 [Geminicoccales bacterium]
MAKNGDDGQYPPKGQGEGDTPPTDPLSFPAQDMYTSRALGARKRDFFPDSTQTDWIPVLLRLKNTTALAFARGKTKEGAGARNLLSRNGMARWLNAVRVSRLHLRSGQRPRETLFVTAQVRPEFFTDFLEAIDDEGGPENPKLRSVVQAITIGTPSTRQPMAPKLFEAGLSEDVPEPLEDIDLDGNPPSDGLVIVAIIDDGIAFGNERFWQADGDTRIEYVWLQDRAFEVPGGTPSSDFDYGREIKRGDINTALSDVTAGGMVDEDSFYRHIGAVKFEETSVDVVNSVAKRISHGAHIMDTAAGYDHRDPTQRAMAEKRPMICVQLPTDVTADTSGKQLEPHLFEAIRYILHRADLIARDRITDAGTGTGPIPVVINFSYGHHLGAHDGTLNSEEAIEDAIAERMATHNVPLRVVVPSGNSHLSRTHANVDFIGGATAVLHWRIQPDGKAWSFMEIWLPPGMPADRMTVSITPPGGGGTPPFGATPPLSEVVAGFQQLPPFDSAHRDIPHECKITYRHNGLHNRGRFLIEIAPTERLGPHHEVVARSGVWEITLRRNAAFPSGEVVNAWIWRDGPPLGFPIRGRQSYFDHDCYQRYDDYGRLIEIDDPACKIRREGTISGLATTDGEMIVAGGYIGKEDRPSPYSSGGPTNGTRIGPDAMAVSHDSVAHRGRLAAGTRSGSVGALDGTSVAAPQIARWISENVARNDLPNRGDVELNADPFPGQPVPDPRRGYGRIEISPIVPHERFKD